MLDKEQRVVVENAITTLVSVDRTINQKDFQSRERKHLYNAWTQMEAFLNHGEMQAMEGILTEIVEAVCYEKRPYQARRLLQTYSSLEHLQHESPQERERLEAVLARLIEEDGEEY